MKVDGLSSQQNVINANQKNAQSSPKEQESKKLLDDVVVLSSEAQGKIGTDPFDPKIQIGTDPFDPKKKTD